MIFLDAPTKPVAMGLATFLMVVNIFGVKQTGRLQALIVSGVLAVLAFFIADGLAHVDLSPEAGDIDILLEMVGVLLAERAP